MTFCNCLHDMLLSHRYNLLWSWKIFKSTLILCQTYINAKPWPWIHWRQNSSKLKRPQCMFLEIMRHKKECIKSWKKYIANTSDLKLWLWTLDHLKYVLSKYETNQSMERSFQQMFRNVSFAHLIMTQWPLIQHKGGRPCKLSSYMIWKKYINKLRLFGQKWTKI
jgi:hypothetical protein